MYKDISIQSKSQIEHINDIACKAPFEIWLHGDSIMLDARSLLGLYALIGQRVHVVAEDDVDPRQFSKIVSKMEH